MCCCMHALDGCIRRKHYRCIYIATKVPQPVLAIHSIGLSTYTTPSHRALMRQHHTATRGCTYLTYVRSLEAETKSSIKLHSCAEPIPKSCNNTVRTHHMLTIWLAERFRLTQASETRSYCSLATTIGRRKNERLYSVRRCCAVENTAYVRTFPTSHSQPCLCFQVSQYLVRSTLRTCTYTTPILCTVSRLDRLYLRT